VVEFGGLIMPTVVLNRETILVEPGDVSYGGLELDLPLPDIEGVELDVEDIDSDLPPDAAYSLDYVATSGSLFIRKRDAFPRSIAWKVFHKSHVIELCPVDLAGGQVRPIRIASPLQILDNCVAVSEEVNYLVVDFVSRHGFMYTVAIPWQEFTGTDCTLSDSNASNWRSLKRPYSFDIRQPYVVRSVTSRLLIVSLKDGTLVKLERDSALGDLNCEPFQDPGSRLMRLLWSGDRIHGHPDLSSRTVVDMAIHRNLLVTISVNRSLKVWSISDRMVIQEQILGGEQEHAKILDIAPRRLLSVCNDHLVTYDPTDEGMFKLWRLSDAGVASLDIEFVPPTPHVQADTSIWYVGDFSVVSNKGKLMLTVAWKSDTSSYIRSTFIRKGRSPVWMVTDTSSEMSNLDRSSAPAFLSSLFTQYSVRTIDTAAAIYSSHFGGKIISDKSVSVFSRISQTVGASVSIATSGEAFQRDLKLQWDRFERLCAALDRRGREFLSLVYDSHNEHFWVVKSSFVAVVRQVTEVELYFLNRSSDPDAATVDALSKVTHKTPQDVASLLKLVDAVTMFGEALLPGTHQDILQACADDFASRDALLTVERMRELAGVLGERVTDSAVKTLFPALEAIHDIDRIVGTVRLLWDATATRPTDTAPLALSYSGRQFLDAALLEFTSMSKRLVLDVIIVLVVSASSIELVPEHDSLFPGFVKLLKSICFVHSVQNALHSSPALPVDLVKQVDLLSVRDETHQSLSQLLIGEFLKTPLNGHTFPVALQYVWGKFCDSSELCVVTALTETSPDAVSELANSFLSWDTFSTFVRANVLLRSGQGAKAVILLRGASIGLSSNKLSQREIQVASKLQYSSDSFGNGLRIYYYACAEVARSLGQFSEALELAQCAIECGDGNLVRINSLLFDCAIRLRAFDDAYNCLVELNLASCPKHMMLGLVDRLITSMAATGDGLRLCRLPFIGLSDLVVSVLEDKLSNMEADRTKTVDYYKLLYSWKIERGDYRGGKSKK
jgi:nuclear pore complex protein Nup160